jgi:hypothetical protein
MERELNSIEKDIEEALKIEDHEERQTALEELFNEGEIVKQFYQSMINTVMAMEVMTIDQNGNLRID